MTYELRFSKAATREWKKLGETVRSQFENILRRRLEEPHIPAARFHGFKSTYKIKLRAAGYRMVYRVYDDRIIVYVIGVGRRDEFYEELVEAGV